MKRRALVLLVVLIPAGLATKVYSGPGEVWVRAHAGGFLYVLFWSLLGFLLFPRRAPWAVATVVLGVTTAFEFLQLWKPPPLEAVRGTSIGRTLIGSSFSWADLPYYGLGALAAVAAWKALVRPGDGARKEPAPTRPGGRA
ncbi:MAG: DUF2809 domain-containing protein [Gemmatimonadota bacterium]|nr:DUF2809 domain-containing protein [Gemmatimonadota bacterium]